ncbi:PilZ domain-containing protein [Pontixanthobacter aquaemixtae]|uniref:PilZ domain-containing protein n=1 Tax=Pontixanthobacter aquaemixtae TaxID=1958940 RepID=A0A844ZV63_9SPHN|nr:PilZ domain-containing protein [Pontixanthobacter aquaemixtae]MXO90657.1 hypothetical protein [Pontixanthobacter aquaemixtae]
MLLNEKTLSSTSAFMNGCGEMSAVSDAAFLGPCPEFGENQIFYNQERRAEERVVGVFRLCCLEIAGGNYLGVVRNISTSGAQIQTDLDLSIGDEVAYHWDGIEPVKAHVVWTRSGLIGIQHRSAFSGFERAQPTRAVRVACELDAKLWINGIEKPFSVKNISVTGLGGSCDEILSKGDLLTVSVARRIIDSATVRWCNSGRFGIEFRTPLALQKAMDILARDRARREQA